MKKEKENTFINEKTLSRITEMSRKRFGDTEIRKTVPFSMGIMKVLKYIPENQHEKILDEMEKEMFKEDEVIPKQDAHAGIVYKVWLNPNISEYGKLKIEKNVPSLMTSCDGTSKMYETKKCIELMENTIEEFRKDVNLLKIMNTEYIEF